MSVDPSLTTGAQPDTHSLCDAAPTYRSQAPADRFMRRLLRLPSGSPEGTAAEARSAFQTSIAVASVRCLLMYVVFPFVLPALGVASGVGPIIGIPIGVLAIVAITYSMRRFWRADHSKRWHYTGLGGAVIVFMTALIIRDLISLLT
jgi:hypothetical protein